MGESDLGSEQSPDAQTPRPSEKDEAVLSREVSKVGRNAATEEVEKAPPERRSHRSRRGQVGKPFCPDDFERNADEGIWTPSSRRSDARGPLLLGKEVGDPSGETGIPRHYGK